MSKPVNPNIIHCQMCGITNLDGAPDLGIPYPELAEYDCGMLCLDCAGEYVKAEETDSNE